MMIKKSYNDFDTFMQDIIDVYLENEGFSVLCDYKLACKIIKKFLSFDDKTKINSISLDPPEWNGYGGEVITISTDSSAIFFSSLRQSPFIHVFVSLILFKFLSFNKISLLFRF